MILTGPEIEENIRKGTIVITPLDTRFIGPNSVDLHLDDGPAGLVTYDTSISVLDPDDLPPLVPVCLDHSGRWLLHPGRLYLGVTREWTETIGFVPYIDGRSSLGRLGVTAHQTAGRGDDGFEGRWTLELSVVQPVLLRPGGRYFQITYHTVVGERRPYKGRYQKSSIATQSLLSKV